MTDRTYERQPEMALKPDTDYYANLPAPKLAA